MRGATGTERECIRHDHAFLLTRPMRGATHHQLGRLYHSKISTHTPHAGRDDTWEVVGEITRNFYSHAPCGARPRLQLHPGFQIRFLLTRPMRGATATYSTYSYRVSYIQEADSKIITKYSIKFNILHDPAIKSRRTCLSFMHHNTFACYSP